MSNIEFYWANFDKKQGYCVQTETKEKAQEILEKNFKETPLTFRKLPTVALPLLNGPTTVKRVCRSPNLCGDFMVCPNENGCKHIS